MFTITIHHNGQLERTPFYLQPPPRALKPGEWLRDFYVEDDKTFCMAAVMLANLHHRAINDEMRLSIKIGLTELDHQYRALVHGKEHWSHPHCGPLRDEFLERVRGNPSFEGLAVAARWWEEAIRLRRRPANYQPLLFLVE